MLTGQVLYDPAGFCLGHRHPSPLISSFCWLCCPQQGVQWSHLERCLCFESQKHCFYQLLTLLTCLLPEIEKSQLCSMCSMCFKSKFYGIYTYNECVAYLLESGKTFCSTQWLCFINTMAFGCCQNFVIDRKSNLPDKKNLSIWLNWTERKNNSKM